MVDYAAYRRAWPAGAAGVVLRDGGEAGGGGHRRVRVAHALLKHTQHHVTHRNYTQIQELQFGFTSIVQSKEATGH